MNLFLHVALVAKKTKTIHRTLYFGMPVILKISVIFISSLFGFRLKTYVTWRTKKDKVCHLYRKTNIWKYGTSLMDDFYNQSVAYMVFCVC